MEHFIIHTDGGARGNPGPSGIGAVIEKEGAVVDEIAMYVGERTNNWAEYEALVQAFARARAHARAPSQTTIAAYLDSELVVRQLTGVYKVRDKNLLVQYEKVRTLAALFKNVTYTHIPREKNSRADALANRAMDTGQ